jgi:hypothetical protein
MYSYGGYGGYGGGYGGRYGGYGGGYGGYGGYGGRDFRGSGPSRGGYGDYYDDDDDDDDDYPMYASRSRNPRRRGNPYRRRSRYITYSDGGYDDDGYGSDDEDAGGFQAPRGDFWDDGGRREPLTAANLVRIPQGAFDYTEQRWRDVPRVMISSQAGDFDEREGGWVYEHGDDFEEVYD